jgi:hypothetical protein
MLTISDIIFNEMQGNAEKCREMQGPGHHRITCINVFTVSEVVMLRKEPRQSKDSNAEKIKGAKTDVGGRYQQLIIWKTEARLRMFGIT